MLRGLVRTVGALIVLAAAGLVGWRVLAPAEVLASVTTPLPAPTPAAPGVTGRTNVAPLIVDGQIRVYAGKRQIRADGPVSAKTVYTPVWSFRRWPQQLSGVVAAGPTVISQWSDGDVVAIDGHTGKITWRISGSSAVDRYFGHRTGAATVWGPTSPHGPAPSASPPSTASPTPMASPHSAGSPVSGMRVGTDVVAVPFPGQIRIFDVKTGALRWSGPCVDGFTSAGGQYFCGSSGFDLADGTNLANRPGASTPIGPYQSVGCEVSQSRCAGLRDRDGHGWLVDGPRPRRAVALDRPGSTTAGGAVFYPDEVGYRAATPDNRPLGDYPGVSDVLGATDGRVLLLTTDRRLLAVDPRTGATGDGFPLAYKTEELTWTPGRWQVSDGYVAIERLTTDGPADPDTPGHYFSVETVIIAAV